MTSLTCSSGFTTLFPPCLSAQATLLTATVGPTQSPPLPEKPSLDGKRETSLY